MVEGSSPAGAARVPPEAEAMPLGRQLTKDWDISDNLNHIMQEHADFLSVTGKWKIKAFFTQSTART